MRNRLEDLAFKLSVINLLRLAKEEYTYQELSKRLGLPVSVLNRYVKGYVLPRSSRNRMLWESLSEIVKLNDEIMKRLRYDEQGYFDNTAIVSNINLLKLAAQYALDKFVGKRVTLVLTAAVDGIPLATLVSSLLNKNILVAKKEKEVGVRAFLEEVYIPSNSAITTTLYIPKGSIAKGDCVLIVDDVIRSGETQRALINLTQKAKADVVGIFSLIVVGNEWEKKIPSTVPVDFVYSIKD